MRLRNIKEINDFLRIVESCIGEVYLASKHGDKIYLKSNMSRYVAIGALLGEHGDELELFCENKADEAKFIGFFYEHSDLL
jgi:hypothetical protein